MSKDTTTSCQDCCIEQKEIASLQAKLFSNQPIDDVIRSIRSLLIKSETDQRSIVLADKEIDELCKRLGAIKMNKSKERNRRLPPILEAVGEDAEETFVFQEE